MMPQHASQRSTNPLSATRPQIRQKQRISHTKSRNGCFACKNRRVKCDEERPICGACSVRGDDCAFPHPQGTDDLTRSRSVPHCDIISHDENHPGTPPVPHVVPIQPLNFNVPRTGTLNPDSESRGCLNMHELNLLQHYILHTSKKMSLNPRKILVWERVIPDITAKNAFLMHLLLALAGLDILTTNKLNEQRFMNAQIYQSFLNESINPSSSDTVELQALVQHHQKGLQGLQEKLATTGDTNTEVLFVGSMLIVGFAFASLRVRDLDPLSQISQPSSAMDSASPGTSKLFDRPQIHWLRLVRGVSSIVQQSWRPLKLSRLRPLLLYSNANDEWKLLGPEPVPTTAPPGNIWSESLSGFALGAPRAVSNLREFLSTLKAMRSGPGDGFDPSPMSTPSPGANGKAQTDQLFAAQDQTIAVVEEMYMRIIYVLQLQQIELCSSDRDAQAEMEDAAISSWPHLVPETFISSLDSDNRLDMSTSLSFTILAHLYLPLAILDEIWYFGKNFAMETQKINTLVAELGNPKLFELMAWPMNVISLQRDTP